MTRLLTPSAPITRREWRAVAICALLLIVLTSIPYAVGWLAQGETHRFSGAVIGADDFQSYIGKMRLGARGIWDFYIFYTPEPHDPVPLVYLNYILPGQVVGLFLRPDDPALTPTLIAVYHAMRLLFNCILIFILYRFITVFLRSPIQRMTALLLATLGGGFGWLLAFFASNWLGSLPPDVYIPEGFSFIILLSLPHLAFARAALLGGMLALFHALDVRRWLGWSLLAGISWCLLGMTVPFYLAVIYCVLGAWGLAAWIRQRRFPLTFAVRAGCAVAITLPLFIYYALAFSRNAMFAAWAAQNDLPSPHLLQYLVAYSIFIMLGWWGIRWAWRRTGRQLRYALIVGWVLAAPLLVYLPINVQRRMAEAMIIPLAILAAHGLAVITRRIRRRQRTPIRQAVIACASLTSLFLVLTTTLGAGTARDLPTHIPQGQLDAYAWLNAHAPENAVVLSSVATGNLLPAYTDLRTYVGHGPETLDWQNKEATTVAFYSGQLDAAQRAALYAAFNIRFVFDGPNERSLTENAASLPRDPDWPNDLQLVYEAGNYRIYAVP